MEGLGPALACQRIEVKTGVAPIVMAGKMSAHAPSLPDLRERRLVLSRE